MFRYFSGLEHSEAYIYNQTSFILLHILSSLLEWKRRLALQRFPGVCVCEFLQCVMRQEGMAYGMRG